MNIDVVSLNTCENKEFLLIRHIFDRILPIFWFSVVWLQRKMAGHVQWPIVMYITDTSSLLQKNDLANLKSDVDKLDIHELKMYQII